MKVMNSSVNNNNKGHGPPSFSVLVRQVIVTVVLVQIVRKENIIKRYSITGIVNTVKK